MVAAVSISTSHHASTVVTTDNPISASSVSASLNSAAALMVLVVNEASVFASSSNAGSSGFFDTWPILLPTAVVDGGVHPIRSDEGSPVVHTSEYSTGNHTSIDRFSGMLSEIQPMRNLSLTYLDIKPIPLKQEVHAGSVFKDFKEDWYNRIHVTPTSIALGNLLSEVSRSFEVWNAYLSTKALTAINETNTEGLVLTRPTPEPATYLALQSRIYDVAIQVNGPASINGLYGVTFGTDVVNVNVTGSRITVFPFEPQWDGLVSERTEWMTNVITSYDGSETRASLRQIPRKSYEFSIVINKNEFRRFDALMMNWQTRAFAVPVWSDYHISENSITAGTTVIATDTTNRDYMVGDSVILLSGIRYETAQIDSFNATSITVKLPLVSNWPEFTKIAPTRVVRLQQKLATSFISTEASKVKLIFKVEGNDNYTPTESTDMYRGVAILLEQPNYDEPRSSVYESSVVEIDNTISTPSYEIQTFDIDRTTNYKWIRKTKLEVQVLKEWLHARKGRLKPIWVPTWDHDMEVSTETLSGANSIDIVEQGYTQHVVGKLNRRDILVRYTDGSYDIGRVLGSTSSGDVETIQLDIALSQTTSKTNVIMISYVELKRLTSDAVEIAWITPDIAKVSQKLVTVYHDI